MAANAFNLSLRNVCGLSQAASNAIVAQGITDPEDFILFEESNIDSMIKHALKANVGAFVIPYLSVVKIKACRHWALTRQRIGLDFNPADFDINELEFTQDLMKERRNQKAAAQDDPEKPPEFKDMSEWRTFWEKFDNCMSQICGAAEIPLPRVCRDTEDATAEARAAACEDNDTRHCTITALDGSHCREDDKRVYEELKATVINGPGWTFVKRFERAQDGRSAMIALKRQAEGRSATDTRKQRAYSQIATARCAGPRRNWNFQKCIERHQGAQNELRDLGEAVPETKAVTDFMTGVTDPRLVNAKDIILGDPRYLNSFEETQQYLATLVANKAEQSKLERNVSELGTRKPGGGGGGGGRGGKKPEIKTGNCARDEWKKLGSEGQAKVRALRVAKKKAQAEAKRKAEIAQLDTDGGDLEDTTGG